MTDTPNGWMLKGSQILLESLINQGVDTIFGYPGGSIMPVYDALYDYTDRLRHILVRHEQGAIHAAQGYARVKNFPGTVTRPRPSRRWPCPAGTCR